MLLAVILLSPFGLLGLLLLMHRVEQPLTVDQVGVDLEHFLDTARPDEVETFVTEGYGPALNRYWRRRRLVDRLAPGRLSPEG